MFYLEFRPMNEQDMIDYLGEIEDLEEKIPLMLQNAYKKCESKEECIYRNMFQLREADGSSRDKYRSGDPVFRTIVAVRRDMARQSRSVELEIRRIRCWKEKMDYVNYCLLQLAGEQREILTALYVRKESRKAYGLKKCLSEATTRRRRREAMENLLCRYNSRFLKGQKGERAGHENV